MNKYIKWFLPALALVACDAPKIPITGTRIPVVTYESSVKVDAEAQDVTIALPLSEIGREWPQTGGGGRTFNAPFLSSRKTCSSLDILNWIRKQRGTLIIISCCE